MRKGHHWKFFTEFIDEKQQTCGKCIFCGTKYVTNAERMTKHIRNCLQIPEDEKKKFFGNNSTSASKRGNDSRLSSLFHAPQKPGPRNDSAVADVETISDVSRPASSSSRPSSSTPKLNPWFDSMPKEQKEKLDSMLTKAWCSLGLSANALANPEFNEFIAHIRPIYSLPKRDAFARTNIPKEYDRIFFQVKESVLKAPFVCLCSDGFQDVARNHVYNIICQTPTPFLWKTIDTTNDRETSSYLSAKISEEIEKIGSHKVIAIVTDHAANVRACCRELQEKYPWLLMEGCKAHLLNLLARDICEKTLVTELIKDCSKITTFFRRKVPQNVFWNAQKEAKETKRQLVFACPTRWSTYLHVFMSFKKNKIALESAARSPLLCKEFKAETNEIKNIMDVNFWKIIDALINILKPLGKTIGLVESDENFLGIIFDEIEKCFDNVMNAAENSCLDADFVDFVKTCVQHRREMGESSIGDLIYALDPTKLLDVDCIDEEQIEKDKKRRDKAEELLSCSFAKNPKIGESVMVEFAKFNGRLAPFNPESKPYAWKHDTTNDMVQFWNGFYHNSKLSQVVHALRCMVLSSAAAERNFSIRGVIHTKSRNRLSVENASKQTFIKHNLKLFRNLKKKAVVSDIESDMGQLSLEESEDDVVFTGNESSSDLEDDIQLLED